MKTSRAKTKINDITTNEELRELFAAKFAFHYRQSTFGLPLSSDDARAALEALDASYEAFDEATQLLLREATGQFIRMAGHPISEIAVDIALDDYGTYLNQHTKGNQALEEHHRRMEHHLDEVRTVAETALEQIATALLRIRHGDNLHTFHWLSHGVLYYHEPDKSFVITLMFGGITTPLLRMAAQLKYERPALPVWLQG